MKGFTLIEVVMALTILATLTILSTQSIQQGIKSKIKIQEQVDQMSKVRDSLRVIERDVNLAYHYRDLDMEFLAEVACRAKPANAQPVPPPPGQAFPPAPAVPANSAAVNPACLEAFPNDPKIKEKYINRRDPETQFIGQNESVDFVTMNVSRVSETQVMADFAKVGYSLKSCKKIDGTAAGQCLVRRFSTLVEGDVTKGGEDTVMLEDVTEFKLRYFGKGKQDWITTWMSNGNDAGAKGKFPDAVEISLTIEPSSDKNRTKKKKYSMQLVAPVRQPNNKEKTEPNGGGVGGA